MTLVTMSGKEFGRLGVLRDVDAGNLTAAAAAAVLGLTERQIYRLLKAYRQDGPSGSASRRRGQPSDRLYPKSFRETRDAADLRVLRGISARRWLEFIREKQLQQPQPKRKARGVRSPGQLPTIFKVS